MVLSDCLDRSACSLCSMLSGAPADSAPSPEVDRLTGRIESLLDEFRARHAGLTLAAAAAQAFHDLAQIPKLLHWDSGLREAVFGLVLAAINQAERFGSGTGDFKRRFTIDVVTRAMREYDRSGLVELVEDQLVEPIVGIQIDWVVEVLNVNDAWKPMATVQLPRLYQGRHGKALFIAGVLWRLISRLQELLLFPSRYERHVRAARTAIDAQVRELLVVLPPSSLHRTTELLLSVVARIGRLTAPYAGALTALLQLVREFEELDEQDRDEVVLRAILLLLREAYRNDSLALLILDSPLGRLFVGQMVSLVKWVLMRNDLLAPATVPGLPALARRR